MSQTSKTLKKIASGEEYQTLVTALEQADYDAVCTAYTRIAELLEAAQSEIEETIGNLPRQNRDEDRQKFLSAFASRCRTTLPLYHLIDSKIKQQKIMEGVVFGTGAKGDPLVRTPQGRVVVIRESGLKEGDRAKFTIIAEGDKVDFGKVFQLNSETIYLALNQETWDEIESVFASLREYMDSPGDGSEEDGLARLNQCLKRLEEVREIASKLRQEEREKTLARVAAHRRRLLKDYVLDMVFDFLTRQEEGEIADCCRDNGDADIALSAPGIFRQETHQAVKAELLSSEKPEAYQQTLDKMGDSMDSMDSALKFLDLKEEIDKLYPTAKKYLKRMDDLFHGLSQKARQVAFRMGEDSLSDISDIRAAVEKAFSGAALHSELRRAFRTSKEFFSLRAALRDLRAKMGDGENSDAEAALKPYLSRIAASAFGDGR